MQKSITQKFKTHIQSRIRHLIFNNKIHFSQQPTYHMTAYKIHTETDWLALYSIRNIDKENIDIHYIMNDEDTGIHIQETDTEFANQMHKLIKTKFAEQHVK